MNIIFTSLKNKSVAIFKLPKDFNPESFNYKVPNDKSDPLNHPELRRGMERHRLNKLGAEISDYLSLIKSANLQLSDFEALSSAIELYKIESLKEKVESLKEIEVTGNVDADISGSISIDDSVYVHGDVSTNVSGSVDAGVSGSLSIDDSIYVRGDITTS